MYSSQAEEASAADERNANADDGTDTGDTHTDHVRVATRLNHFDYFTEIEEYFLRRRAKTLLLSPMDWALIEGWKQKGVPLHVVLRGIERAFDSFDRRPATARRRSIKTLFYCAEEVEAQHAEWLESQVGATPNATGDDGVSTSEQSSLRVEMSESIGDSAFSPAAIRAHLDGRRELLAALHERPEHDPVTLSPAFRESLARVEARLDELARDWQSAVSPPAERLEDALTQLEALLDEHLRSCFTATQLSDEERHAQQQLAAYKARMEAATYQTTFAHLVMKRLRERLNVPRLSLFYL